MSYLEIDNPAAVLTALKPPQQESIEILRLVNPSGDQIEDDGQAARSAFLFAHLVNLAEKPRRTGRIPNWQDQGQTGPLQGGDHPAGI